MRLRNALVSLGSSLARRRDSKVEAIQAIPTFATCDGDALNAIASMTTELDLDAGVELAVQGRRQRQVFVLVEGSAEAVRDGETVAELRRGDPVGELEVVAGGSPRATVRTTTPTRALVIADQDFRQLVSERPAVASALLAAVARREVLCAA